MELDSPGPAFAVDETSIDPKIYGYSTYANPTNPAPRIDRRSAIQVPAVKRIRDLIATSLGGLPIDLYNPQKQAVRSNLFEQPERNVPRSVTMTKTAEDLLFEGIAWWRIVEFGWHNYPVKVQRLEPSTVNVREDGKVYVNGAHVPDTDLIRFDSPNDALLVAGARAIRTCLTLDASAARYADGAPPIDYFTPADGVDPAEDEDVVGMLDDWQKARQARATGYVPGSLKYNVAGWSPEQLQMADARQHAVLEIARVAGVDAEELGVSTTSRTYANQFDRRKAFLDFTLGGYLHAIEDRLGMGDVTPRDYYVRLNLDAFLRSDTKTRYETYEIGLRTGALTGPEIRGLEDRQPLTESQTPEVSPVAATQTETQPAATFADDDTLTFDAPVAPATFEVDREARTIRGLALPYGVSAVSRGRTWQFAKGVLQFDDVSRIKLLAGHDWSQAIGRATAIEDTDEGLVATFKVARGAEGDRALTLAEDGVWDGLSVGLGNGIQAQVRDGVHYASSAPLREISLTPCPAFDGARVTEVAASAAHNTEGTPMDNETTEVQPDFTALTDAIKAGFSDLAFPQQRETVAAGGRVEVNEAPPYRFDGVSGEHSFSADLRSSASGDSAAKQRLETFMDEAFAVSTSNVTSLNPTQNRPELYVPNLEYTRPLWSLVSTGVVNDVTPFTIPKFASAAGLVGPHTQGVEPTPGSFSATNQTVTPTPVSGKIEINREVWDQGGNPKADTIIWREMLNGYYEALEAKIATMLNGLSLTEINLAGATDAALVNAVQNVFVDLQFVRGGNRYSALALDGMLFKALVNAADTSGRKLLPIVNPSNAQGSTAGNFGQVQIGSQTGAAAWALGATNASNSYLFVPGSVWAWASAPKQFTFEYQVKSVDMAVWGYSASAVLRDSDVKRLDYTTADV